MRIKQWFKTFGLSFFSDKITNDVPKFGFAGVLISLVLAFIFIMCGYYGSDVAPFSTHYKNATQYGQFIHSAFDNGVELSMENAVCKCDKIINTYTNEEDKAAYSLNGYNLIIDTRPSDTLIVFEQVAIKGDDGTKKISYEEYLALDAQAKKGYNLAVGFTDELLELTSEMTEKHTEYLERLSDKNSENYDKECAEDYGKLKENRADYSEDAYGKELYELYVSYYYTGVSSTLSRAKAPVLRDYYYANFVVADNAYYFYVFDDMCAGSFETDSGIPLVFGGYFKNCTDGKIADIDAFIIDTYYDTTAYTFISYFASTVSQLFTLVLLPILISLIVWGLGKAVKNLWESSFAGCYKIVNSFVWMSALITAVVIFVCGYFASARLMYKFIPVIFGGILLIRTVIYCIVNAVKNAKQLAKSQPKNTENNEEDIFGGCL